MIGVARRRGTFLQKARDGELDEASLRCEFKESVGFSDKEKRNLAREVASLGLDGGSLVVGIRDPKNREEGASPEAALNPVPL